MSTYLFRGDLTELFFGIIFPFETISVNVFVGTNVAAHVAYGIYYNESTLGE